MSNPADQTFETIPVETLLERVGAMRKGGYRLVQISATRLPEQVELTYSFDRHDQLANLRVQLPATGTQIPSITSVFWCAFLYENELHDLFDIQVDGMAVDFHGHLYETAVKFPFGTTKMATAKPVPARQPAVVAAPGDGRTPAPTQATTT